LADGSQLAVLWFTRGESNKPQVNLSRSKDNGNTFESPLVIEAEDNLGRVAGTYLKDGSTLVAWMRIVSDDKVSLLIRRIQKNGDMGKPIELATLKNSRGTGFPTIAGYGNEAIISWTDFEQNTIRTVLVHTTPD
jgi:hypothetical protein